MSRAALGLVTYTSLYPNSEMPQHGLFVEQRLRRIVATGRVKASVIAPVPWFPFRSSRFGHYGRLARVPKFEQRGEIDIEHPRYPTIPKYGMDVQSKLLAMATRSTVARARREGAQVLDAHYLYPDGVAAVSIGSSLGMPVMMTARGSDVNVIADFPGPRALILSAVRQCAAVITVSQALKTRLISLGAPANRITVLRNGVDLEFFSPGSYEEERAAFGLTGHVILSVGRLVPGKGNSLIIDALARLPDSRLLIAGDGPDRELLKRQASAKGVAARVRFLGSVPSKELRRYYRAADVLVLASANEGMPNVVLEAMACGTPVVATNVGGIPEVLDRSVGRLVNERTSREVEQAIVDLRTAGVDRSAVRQWAERFDWTETVDRSVALFQRVAAS
jgi:teichuronic acid biosynthesis glycosyltransferase TuaC